MHLKTVELKNFRCFKDLRIDLHPRLTVLVAENGEGKTAILDGIAIGLSPVLRYLSTADQRLTGPGIQDTDFRLELLEIRKGEERWPVHEWEERWGACDYTQIVIETTSGLKWDYCRPSAIGRQPELKIGQKELTEYSAKVLESLKTTNPELPVFAYYGANRGWIDFPKRLRESKVDYTQPTSALLGALDSLSDFKEMLKWFDMEEAAELRARQSFLFDPTENTLPLHSALAVVRTAVSAILGTTYTDPHFNAKHKFVIQAKNSPIEFQVSQLSQGYQSMLALGMDFARRLAIANYHLFDVEDSFDWSFGEVYAKMWSARGRLGGYSDPEPTSDPGPAWAPAIMLVDEIDLHLHPSWQQRVLTDLRRAFPNTQLITTTHSPQVISTVPQESIRIIKNGSVYAAPPGTDGAETQRVLEDVFQVSPRPATPMAEALHEYLHLVDERQWDSARAVELRRRLDAWSQGREPRLLEADLIIENMKWESGQ